MFRFIDRRLFTYAFTDVRGYGLSKEIDGKFDLDEIVTDVFNLADDLGWDQFHLIGHSMTGMVVQKAVTSDQHDRIQGLIAITPVPAGGFPIDPDTTLFFKSIITDPKTAAMAYDSFTGQRLSAYWSRQRVENLHENTNPNAMLKYLQMWSQTNFRNEVEGHPKKLLIIYGNQDHPGFQKDAIYKGFNHYPNAKLIEIKNSGHYPMQEVPIQTATRIEDYLNQCIL